MIKAYKGKYCNSTEENFLCPINQPLWNLIICPYNILFSLPLVQFWANVFHWDRLKKKKKKNKRALHNNVSDFIFIFKIYHCYYSAHFNEREMIRLSLHVKVTLAHALFLEGTNTKYPFLCLTQNLFLIVSKHHINSPSSVLIANWTSLLTKYNTTEF